MDKHEKEGRRNMRNCGKSAYFLREAMEDWAAKRS
jgi:hypothetical protein